MIACEILPNPGLSLSLPLFLFLGSCESFQLPLGSKRKPFHPLACPCRFVLFVSSFFLPSFFIVISFSFLLFLCFCWSLVFSIRRGFSRHCPLSAWAFRFLSWLYATGHRRFFCLSDFLFLISDAASRMRRVLARYAGPAGIDLERKIVWPIERGINWRLRNVELPRVRRKLLKFSFRNFLNFVILRSDHGFLKFIYARTHVKIYIKKCIESILLQYTLDETNFLGSILFSYIHQNGKMHD